MKARTFKISISGVPARAATRRLKNRQINLGKEDKLVPTSPIASQLAVSKPISDSTSVSTETSENRLTSQLRAELSLWLAGICAFLQPENYTFKEAAPKNFVEQNWAHELRALRYATMRAADLVSRLAAKSHANDIAAANVEETKELSELYLILSRFSIVCEDLSAIKKFDYYAWRNLGESLLKDFGELEFLQKLITDSAELPTSLDSLRRTSKAELPFGTEVLTVIARLSRLLAMLGIVGAKLSQDAPLKNSLLFFSLIHSETKNLLKYIEQRILRSMPPENEFFDILDGTIYIISLELRKVYTRELKGVLEIRSAPTVVARVETSHGLLQDCFQQSIILLANAFDPNIEGWRIFPNYQTRLEQSLVLRTDLWRVLQHVQRAEASPEIYPLEKIKIALENFRRNSLQFLMFKDCEPTERFVEEILQTKRLTDVTHVLHRFGAYLETLLGQVNMRGVLANHPFDYPKIED